MAFFCYKPTTWQACSLVHQNSSATSLLLFLAVALFAADAEEGLKRRLTVWPTIEMMRPKCLPEADYSYFLSCIFHTGRMETFHSDLNINRL